MEKKDSKVTDKTGQKKNVPVTPFEASLRTYCSTLTPTLNTTRQPFGGSGSQQNMLTVKSKTRSSQATNTKRKDFSSTPSRCSQLSSLRCDISAIELEQSNLPLIREPLGSRVKSSYKIRTAAASNPSLKKSNRTGSESILKREKVEDFHNAEMSYLYVEAVQATYLASQAKKSAAERDKLAVEKLTKLSKANQILMKQEKMLNAELNGLKILSQIMEYCRKEESMLHPLTKVLPDLMEHYKEIAMAVDAIRHKLHTPGVSAPLDSVIEDQFSGIVKWINQLLLNVLEKSNCCGPEFEEKEKLVATMFNLIKEITSEMKKCLKLLKRAHGLMITETSLKIAEVHSSQD